MKNRFGVSLWTEELIMMIYDPEGIAKDYLKQMLKSQIKENYRLVKNTGIQIGLFEKQRFTKKADIEVSNMIDMCDTDLAANMYLYSLFVLFSKASLLGETVEHKMIPEKETYLNFIKNTKGLKSIIENKVLMKTRPNYFEKCLTKTESVFKELQERKEKSEIKKGIKEQIMEFESLKKETTEEIRKVLEEGDLTPEQAKSFVEQKENSFYQKLRETSSEKSDSKERVVILLSETERKKALTKTELEIFEKFQELKNIMFKSVYEKAEENLNKKIEVDLITLVGNLFKMYESGEVYSFHETVTECNKIVKDTQDFIEYMKKQIK